VSALGPTLETLTAVADEMLRIGRSPNIGTTVPLPVMGLSIMVKRHRTAAPTGLSLPFREISWQ